MKGCYLFDKNYCFTNRCDDMNSEVEEDTYEKTKLHLAAFRNDVKMVESILSSGIMANYKNKCGQTALLIAVQKGNIEVVEVLLSWGANVNMCDLRGYSALQVAMDANNEEMVDLLIASCLGG